jgi:phosphoglycolate phosphatase
VAPSGGLVVGFDLDMTLIDPRPGVRATVKALNAELGTAVDPDGVAAELGPPLEEVVARWVAPGDVMRVCDRFRALYARLGPPGTTLLPGAAEAVAAARARGRAVVVTGKYGPNARRCLQAVGLRVDAVIGWRHGPGKTETLAALGAHLYVGDTPADVRAARCAGAVAVGVATGGWSVAELRGAGAAVVLPSLALLPAVLARTPDPPP